MNEFLVILAISVIIIGFLILVGIAVWLAAERRSHLAAATHQRENQPAAQPPAPQGAPAAAPAPATPPVPAEAQASSTPTSGTSLQKEPHASGEYPSAALYDQTLLPQPPKRHTRPSSK